MLNEEEGLLDTRAKIKVEEGEDACLVGGVADRGGHRGPYFHRSPASDKIYLYRKHMCRAPQINYGI